MNINNIIVKERKMSDNNNSPKKVRIEGEKMEITEKNDVMVVKIQLLRSRTEQETKKKCLNVNSEKGRKRVETKMVVIVHDNKLEGEKEEEKGKKKGRKEEKEREGANREKEKEEQKKEKREGGKKKQRY